MLTIKDIIELSNKPNVNREAVENLLMNIHSVGCKTLVLRRIINITNTTDINWETVESLLIGTNLAFENVVPNCSSCNEDDEDLEIPEDEEMALKIVTFLKNTNWREVEFD